MGFLLQESVVSGGALPAIAEANLDGGNDRVVAWGAIGG
jgi:hypothetical protein